MFPSEWLISRVSVEEAEAAHPGVTNKSKLERRPDAAKPFGFQNARWEQLKAEMQPGDELWTYSSSAKSFRALAGRAGVVLLRDGEVVAQVVTMMS